MLGSMAGLNSGTRALAAAMAADGGKHVIIVNVPVEIVTLHVHSLREQSGTPEPESIHQLYAGASALAIERVDARTLDMRATLGWARMPFEHVFAASSSIPRLGASVVVSGLRAEVMEVGPTGMPLRVRFHFIEALESSRYSWLAWQGDHPAPWKPPSVGEHLDLPALSMVTALKHE
jgi:hypothetical protein